MPLAFLLQLFNGFFFKTPAIIREACKEGIIFLKKGCDGFHQIFLQDFSGFFPEFLPISLLQFHWCFLQKFEDCSRHSYRCFVTSSFRISLGNFSKVSILDIPWTPSRNSKKMVSKIFFQSCLHGFFQ